MYAIRRPPLDLLTAVPDVRPETAATDRISPAIHRMEQPPRGGRRKVKGADILKVPQQSIFLLCLRLLVSALVNFAESQGRPGLTTDRSKRSSWYQPAGTLDHDGRDSGGRGDGWMGLVDES